MKRLFAIFAFLLIGLTPFLSVSALTIPDNQCLCYCTSSEGAERMANVTNEGACKALCDAEPGKVSMLACFAAGEEEYVPENLELCWTQLECTSDLVETNDGTKASEWGGQHRACPKGQGYCYNPPGTIHTETGTSSTVVLGVPIGDLERPDDLAEYIAALYAFLLPVGALIAVLMFMIAGVQWMTAGGNAGAVASAKTRLGNATLGLALLLLAYTIGALIDPNLVSFDVFRVPKVQKVVFFDGNGSCEQLQLQGIEIGPIDGACGDKGLVESIEGLNEGAVIGVEVGDICFYSTCSDELAHCAGGTNRANAEDDPPSCTRCKDVSTALFGGTSLSPSESVCASLTPTDADPNDDMHYSCGFVETAYFDLASDTCAEVAYPSHEEGIDCLALANDLEESCRAYDFVYGVMGSSKNQLDDIGGSAGYPLLESICTADPCGFAPPGDSCRTFLSISALGGSDGEVFANCANSASDRGLDDCFDSQGDEGSCFTAKDGISDIADLIEYLPTIKP
jgi:hypothetical protein